MILRIAKSLGIAVALVLLGTHAGEPFVRAQTGFRDDASDIPPSPTFPPGPSRFQSIAVGTPAPATASPPQSSPVKLPPAYNLTPVSKLAQVRGRMSGVSGQTPPSSAASPPTPGKVGKYGVGKIGNGHAGVGPYGVGKIGADRTAASPNGANRLPYADGATEGSPQTGGSRPYVTPLGRLPTSGMIRPTNHLDDRVEPGFMNPMMPPTDPSGLPPLIPRLRSPLLGTGAAHPTDRAVPPTILGSHLGLQPGETATERSLRLMSAVGELESQVDTLTEQNADLIQHIKQRDEQLLLAIREIRSARKEVESARDELDRLRQQVKGLQGKVGDAERENAALLQTMAPLLQKLLESDATGSAADGRPE